MEGRWLSQCVSRLSTKVARVVESSQQDSHGRSPRNPVLARFTTGQNAAVMLMRGGEVLGMVSRHGGGPSGRHSHVDPRR
eukprot:8507724-Pyramimonas_sp.AAC.1